jgi:hypothetical protein
MADCQVLVEPGITKPKSKFHSALVSMCVCVCVCECVCESVCVCVRQ